MPRGKKAGPPVMDYDAPAANEEVNDVPHPQMTIPGTEVDQPENEPRQRRPRNPGAPSIKRISFTVHEEDNSIAWERLRDANREEVKKVVTGWMADPSFMASLGIKQPIVEVFSPSWCDTIYDTVGNLEVMLAPKMFGCTLEQANILRYTSAEKDSLREPTARVINKYLPVWLAKFEDEIKLAMLLVSISFVKVQMLRAIAMMPKPQQHANGKEQQQPKAEPVFPQEPAAA